MPTSNSKFSPGYGMLAAGAVSLLISGGALLVRGTGTMNVQGPTFALQLNGTQMALWNATALTLEGDAVVSGGDVTISGAGDNAIDFTNGTAASLEWNGTDWLKFNGTSWASAYKQTVAAVNGDVASAFVSDNAGRGVQILAQTGANGGVGATGYCMQFSAREGATTANTFASYSNCNTGAAAPLTVSSSTLVVGALTAGNGKAVCVKDASGTLGYCSSAVGADGTCTCN